MAKPSWRFIAAVLAILAAGLLGGAVAGLAQGADKVVEANFKSAYMDLVPFLGAVESDRPQVSVQVPSTTPGVKETNE